MAYYDALIAKWATAPAGTTDQKLTWINAETVTGAAVPMLVPTYQIYNLVNTAEFEALTDPNKQLVRDILFMGTVDCSPNTNIRNRIMAMFAAGTATRTALANLAKSYDTPLVPWATAPVALGGGGYPAPITGQDLVNAGLS